MSEQHTPGPWINDAPGCVAKHWPEGGKATVCICPAGAEGEANARLIAAAPDLLAELRNMVAVADFYMKSLGVLPEDKTVALAAARAAIARAEGREP
jgi:hypothetical protein